ncbi:MAG: hypothetical protein VX237_08040, partial [Chloroflexota bacterium]|nr:hypothetical protein [Chloroflexota bacterium]
SDFGNLSQARARAGAVSDGSRGCFGGGAQGPTHAVTDTIDYAVIGNTGNMTDFGNLTLARQYLCATAGD